MKPTKLILLIIVAVVASTVVVALVVWLMPNKSASSGSKPTVADTSDDQTIFSTVKAQVKANGIDVYWTDSECVFVRASYDEEDNKILEIREKHDGKGCAGDPQFSPMVATFRVTSANTVEWFEPISGRYTNLAVYKDSLVSLP